DMPTRVDRAAVSPSDLTDVGTTARRVILPQASDNITPSPGDQSEQARQVPQEAQSDERPPEPVDAGRRDGETVLDMPDFERLALERFAVSGERTEGRVDVGSEVVVRTPASNASETPD